MSGSQSSTSLSDMLFPDAADLWLRSRTGISQITRCDHSCNIKCLSKCFGEMKLAQIQLSHIRDYQAQRAAGTIPGLRKAGPSAINQELHTLKQVLNRAGEWTDLRNCTSLCAPFHRALAGRCRTKRKPSLLELPTQTLNSPENSQPVSSPMFQGLGRLTVFSSTTFPRKYQRFGISWPSS